MAEWGHQNKEGTSPLSPSVEGPMASRAPFTDTFFASEDPLCLSPEDNLRPPAKETLSVSLQRMTDGPLRDAVLDNVKSRDEAPG